MATNLKEARTSLSNTRDKLIKQTKSMLQEFQLMNSELLATKQALGNEFWALAVEGIEGLPEALQAAPSAPPEPLLQRGTSPAATVRRLLAGKGKGKGHERRGRPIDDKTLALIKFLLDGPKTKDQICEALDTNKPELDKVIYNKRLFHQKGKEFSLTPVARAEYKTLTAVTA